ncbi:MAG: capsular biosynthesis protein CpsF [Bacteroides sp.]|nr:capsular biosynthesis protein CpsF [Bacteroides sp.]
MFTCNQGGHFSQMMAMKELFGKYESVLVTDNVRATQEMPALKEIGHIEIMEGESSRRKAVKGDENGSRWSFLAVYFQMLLASRKIWKQYRPKVIISTGSNIAVPLFIIGKLHGSKIIFIETRAKVCARSMTGILVHKMADQIFVQWPEMLELYPEARYCGALA